MADRSGQQLDNYSLIRLLGQGTFGEVYLGEHIRRKKQVAIKILHTRISNEEFYDFINEVRIFRLRHPHIVPVLDFGVEQATSTPFIVMEYAPNGTLRHRHPRGMQLPLPTIVDYVQQIAAALQYAHEENLIHRDVKPENMLIGRNNEVLLSDFGISVVSQSGSASSIQAVRSMAGTPYYMAPEQFLGKASRASDQYALGVVVYEWLSGVRPFKGTFYELFGQHTQVAPPSLPHTIAHYSPALEQVVMRALAKEPKSRFASVWEFAAALEAVCGRGQSVQQVPSMNGKTKQQWLAGGDAHYDALRYAEAVAAYNQAIALDPDCASAYARRGNAYSHLREYERALADYDRALALDPHDAVACNNRGNAYDCLRRYHEALADYDRALALDADYATAYHNRGLAYAHLRQYHRAIADYDQALARDPYNATIYTNRGIAYGLLRQYGKALDDFDRAVALTPDDPRAWYNRGNAYYGLQRYRQAIADFDRALELDPGHNLARHSRAEALRQLEQQWRE
jgi:tetratricopeptide (TPR) repeat protein/tRNA A-37 threonylcarbamoyl transferase component Bud32